ncbi:Galactose-binding domain-like, partial [Trinorchestia longiramus]
PTRGPSNLLDGVYDGQKNTCYHTETEPSPYVVFNLGTTRAVKNVQLIAYPDDNAVKTFQNVDVRVGTFPTSENFSDYKRLGFMSGGAPTPGYVFMTNSSHPLSGQYISVQAYAKNAFQLCHVEIY